MEFVVHYLFHEWRIWKWQNVKLIPERERERIINGQVSNEISLLISLKYFSFEDTGAANYFLNLSQFPNIFFQLNAP